MKPALCRHADPSAVDCPHANDAIATLHQAWPRSRDLREKHLRAFLTLPWGQRAVIETLGMLTSSTLSKAISAPGTLSEPEQRALDDAQARLFTLLLNVERLAEESTASFACEHAPLPPTPRATGSAVTA